jgi:hypothetical protein
MALRGLPQNRVQHLEACRLGRRRAGPQGQPSRTRLLVTEMPSLSRRLETQTKERPMKRLLMPISWLTWKAADLTAWGCEHNLWPYKVYNVTCRFAFWFDERFDLGQTKVIS